MFIGIGLAGDRERKEIQYPGEGVAVRMSGVSVGANSERVIFDGACHGHGSAGSF